MLGLSDIKLGTVLSLNNEPYQVVYTQHIKVARGGATLRTKLKNLVTGSTLEKSFSGADKAEEADLTRSAANFLYEQGGKTVFMDNANFEQYEFDPDVLGEGRKYLKEGQTCDVLIFNGRAVTVALPKKVTLKVTSAPPGVKGDTSGSATKTVTLETGLEIRTPLFIKEGEDIVINTETGDYYARA
ncbi:MAG: elongation factor P [Candidatus Komeilibacteria bacterium]